MIIKCLVVDDEKPARDELKFLLSDIEDIEIAGDAESCGTAYEILKKKKIDLIFLDIEMPGNNGFILLSKLKSFKSPPAVIFVTAYDQYAVKAFEAEALDYILKPVSDERLKLSIDRIRQRIGLSDPSLIVSDLNKISSVLSTIPSFTRIILEKKGKMILANPDDICFFEAFGKNIEANFKDKTLFVSREMTMNRLEKNLVIKNFFRVHRSYLVNLSHIKEFYPFVGGKYELLMANMENTIIPISRSKVKAFKERLIH